MKKNVYGCCIFLFILSCCVMFCSSCIANDRPTAQKRSTYQRYIDFFEEVYQTMNEHYFYVLDRRDFDQFIDKFDQEIFAKIDVSVPFDEFVSMRSAAFLVDALKRPEDKFSALIPPQIAKEFEQQVLGKTIDLGLKGELTEQGYRLTHVEPRADAYRKGLRVNDVIVSIDSVSLLNMNLEDIGRLLTPLEGNVVVDYIEASTQALKTVELISEEYFHQTVFPITIPVEDIYGLKIQQFNQKTGEDLFNFLHLINQQGNSGLILDFRGNPGGPPLAAQEIVSFFLKPDQNFAYFQRKDHDKNYLTVPNIPDQYRYRGPVVILVDEQSGSSSELFSGVMQKQKRAIVMGVNTAGQVFLKSMFTLANDALLVLVTARGCYPNGEYFSFDGLEPQYRIDLAAEELIAFAAGYLKALLNDEVITTK